MGFYQTKELTQVQATLFCQMFDLRIGTEREINDPGPGDGHHYVICGDLEKSSEFQQCEKIEEFVLTIPTNAIQFNTHRFYHKSHDHVITAFSMGVEFESLDWMSDDLNRQWVIFIDPVRMIKGKLFYCPLTAQAVLDAYDRGGYEHV